MTLPIIPLPRAWLERQSPAVLVTVMEGISPVFSSEATIRDTGHFQARDEWIARPRLSVSDVELREALVRAAAALVGVIGALEDPGAAVIGRLDEALVLTRLAVAEVELRRDHL